MRKDDCIENYHGTMVADPYRWLEDSLSAESQAWIGGQNKKTREFLDSPLGEEIRERLTQLWDFPKYELPKEVGGRLFYQKNEGLQNQSVLYCQDPGTEPFQVIDPNTLSTDGTVALTRFEASPDGKLLAYALSDSGSDWQKIRIRNVDTGQEYPETIHWCRFTNLPWTPDGKGFFYSRFPETGTVPPEDQSNYNKVYYHMVGTAQTEDILIYQRPDAKELGFTPIISEDGAYLGLVVTHGTSSRNRFYYRPLDGEDGFVRLLDEGDAAYWPIGNIGSRFFFNTDLEAPRGRVIAIDICEPERENWQEIIAQGEDVIDGVRLVGGQLVVSYMHHACNRIGVFSIQGEEQGEIELPGLGTVTDIWGKSSGNKLYLGFVSFLYPPSVFQTDVVSRQLTAFGETSLSFVPGEYETKQVFYSSKDGTSVPMFITHKKGLVLDCTNPTVLFGYGGFNISMTPNFWPMHLMFMERGGVFAVANLRGGSEYGEDWHRAGMLENKQNVFDDFIAAGEWLIANHYTNSKRLAILGRSNGGLLVSACMTQRPDLYGAVICWVPVIDMLRYHKFTVGRYWTSEYGNAEENPEHFKFMYAYSPLHKVREGVKYPPTLIMTADTDDRVVPGHALKFAATVQEKDLGHNPILLRVESKAGHGPGKPISKLIDEGADMYTFIFKIFDIK
jgi:prolyl oligopeptidase